MTRPFLEVQKELNDYLEANEEFLNNYDSEMAMLKEVASDESFALKCQGEIEMKYWKIKRHIYELQAEREEAHRQLKAAKARKSNPFLNGSFFRSLIDINHPDSPHGERLVKGENWTADTKREYLPGGMLSDGGKIFVYGK